MPQRKFLVATGMLVFDFELFIGDRCDLLGNSLEHAPPVPRQMGGGLVRDPGQPCFSDEATSIMKNFCEFFSGYIRNHPTWEFNKAENHDA
jgi:hypothetical protein